MKSGSTVVPIAIAFEAGLGLAAAGLIRWLNVPLERRLVLSPDAAWRSLIGLAPMLLMLAYVTRSRWRPLVELRRQVEQLVGELFRDVSWAGLALVSLAAGLGEELLFRGALQPLAERWWGPVVGLIAVSVLFGVLHAASRAYFVLATLVGLYLGWMAQRFDDLVAPTAIHAAYDLVALLAIKSRVSGRSEECADRRT